MDIYTHVKKIIVAKGKDITLIVPDNAMLKPSNPGKHPSDWKSIPFSGLGISSFSEEERNLISQLILKDTFGET